MSFKDFSGNKIAHIEIALKFSGFFPSLHALSHVCEPVSEGKDFLGTFIVLLHICDVYVISTVEPVTSIMARLSKYGVFFSFRGSMSVARRFNVVLLAAGISIWFYWAMPFTNC